MLANQKTIMVKTKAKQSAPKRHTVRASKALHVANRYFDATHSRIVRAYLVNQLADLAQQECKPGESVVAISDDSVLESFPGIQLLKVTIRKANKLRHCFIHHPVQIYDAAWLNRQLVSQ